MATEPITATEFLWRSKALRDRLTLLAHNVAGARRMQASFDTERDLVRGQLNDLIDARIAAGLTEWGAPTTKETR